MYIVTVFTLICGICSSVISLCNCAVSFVLLYCYIVTLVRLSLVTIKGYLLCLLDVERIIYVYYILVQYIVQISMSVVRTTEDVVISATTPQAVTSVYVRMDFFSQMTTKLAKVLLRHVYT